MASSPLMFTPRCFSKSTWQCSNSSPTRIPPGIDLEDFVYVYGCLRISSTLRNIADFNINRQCNVILDPAFSVVRVMCQPSHHMSFPTLIWLAYYENPQVDSPLSNTWDSVFSAIVITFNKAFNDEEHHVQAGRSDNIAQVFLGGFGSYELTAAKDGGHKCYLICYL